jgi:hypothetical protein
MDIVSRAAWKAEPPRAAPIRMKLPAKELWVHHSVTGVTENPHADMRLLQQIAFSRKFSDISYSWAVHPSGVVLEGRGFNVGAHTAGRNSTSFGVVLIGDYTKRVVTDAQVDAVRQLVAWLRAEGALSAGVFPTGGHRQAPGASTVCPGEWAMKRIEEMRRPWAVITPPQPQTPPPMVTDFPAGEDHMLRYDLQIALDDKGNGWTRVDVAAGDVVSLIGHGPYPPADAYWNLPVLGRQERDGQTVVTATEGPPGGTVNVTMWALD